MKCLSDIECDRFTHKPPIEKREGEEGLCYLVVVNVVVVVVVVVVFFVLKKIKLSKNKNPKL